MAENAFVKVAEIGELSPGHMKLVEVGDNQIMLANVAGDIYARVTTCVRMRLLLYLRATWTGSRSNARCMGRCLT